MSRHRPWWFAGIIAGTLVVAGLPARADNPGNQFQRARPAAQPASPGRLFGGPSGMRPGPGPGLPFAGPRGGAPLASPMPGSRFMGSRGGPFTGPSFAAPAPGRFGSPFLGRSDPAAGSGAPFSPIGRMGAGRNPFSGPAYSNQPGLGDPAGRMRPASPPIVAIVGATSESVGGAYGRPYSGAFGRRQGPARFPVASPTGSPTLQPSPRLRRFGGAGPLTGGSGSQAPVWTSPQTGGPSRINLQAGRPGPGRGNARFGRPGGYPGVLRGGTTVSPYDTITPIGRAMGSLSPVDPQGHTNVGLALGDVTGTLTPGPRGIRFQHRRPPIFGYDPFSGHYGPYRGGRTHIGVLLGTAATRPVYRFRYGNSFSLFYYPYYSPFYFSSFDPFDFGYPAFPSPYYFYDCGPLYIPSTRVVVVQQPVVIDGNAYAPDDGQSGYSSDDGGAPDDTGSYYLNQGVEQDLSAAMDDIQRAWTIGDIDLLLRHVRSDSDVRVYLKGKYTYSLPSDDYRDLTHDAMQNSHTVSFRWVSTDRRNSDEAYAQAEHTFTDKGGDRHTVYASYTLDRIHGAWWISAVGSSNRKSDPADPVDDADKPAQPGAADTNGSESQDANRVGQNGSTQADGAAKVSPSKDSSNKTGSAGDSGKAGSDDAHGQPDDAAPDGAADNGADPSN